MWMFPEDIQQYKFVSNYNIIRCSCLNCTEVIKYNIRRYDVNKDLYCKYCRDPEQIIYECCTICHGFLLCLLLEDNRKVIICKDCDLEQVTYNRCNICDFSKFHYSFNLENKRLISICNFCKQKYTTILK